MTGWTWGAWVAMLWGLLGMGSLPGGVTVDDMQGTRVVLAQPAQRVVTLLPSLTETVCVLGACERLVATDRWSNWPTSVVSLPKVGGLDDANVEAIVAARPDLVLAARSSRVVARLRDLGVTVAVLEPQDWAGVGQVLAAVASLLGVSEHGQVVWQRLQTEMVAAAATVPASARGQRVYFEIEATPYAAGESSFIGQTLTHLGAKNVVPAALGPFPKLNPEFVVQANPDVIILAERHAAGLRQRPGWAGMKALREPARVCAVPAAAYDPLVRPGPRMGQAAHTMAACLVRAGASG